MTEQEIEVIFNEKIAIIKQYWDKYWAKPEKYIRKIEDIDSVKMRDRIPPLNPIYRRTVEYRDMIKVHSDIDNKPLDLMIRRAPNEDDRQFAYRLRNFENVTMPSFMKALGKLNRIFNPSNFSIQWDKQQTKEKEFFETEVPVFGNLLTYFEEIVLTQKILDPNSLLVVRPYFIPTKQGQDEKGNPVLILDDQVDITPVACVIDCGNVIDYKEAVYALILTEEKSIIKVNDKDKKEGLVFEFYDDENIYRISQEGEKNDWKFSSPVIYYPHKLGYMPAWKLKGIPQQKDMHVLYQSYFIYAIPNLNEALYLNSSLYMSLVTHMHPHLSEWVDRCREEGCDNGIFRYEGRDGDGNILNLSRNCKTCKGTGRASNIGPMMTRQFVIPDQTQGDTDINAVPFPGMQYTAPDVQAPIFVNEKIAKLIEDAWMYINLETSNSDVKGSDTALKAQIDREELFAMLLRISNESFALYDKTQKAIGEMRYGTGFKSPVVSAPTSFSIRSESDLLEELTEAKEAGIPDVALTEIMQEYIEKRYSSKAHIHKIVDLVCSMDRLVVKDQLECAALLANGTASKLEVILHDSIFTFIDNILITDDAFWEKPFEAQKAQIMEMAEAKLKEIEDAKDQEVAKITDKILEIGNANAA